MKTGKLFRSIGRLFSSSGYLDGHFFDLSLYLRRLEQRHQELSKQLTSDQPPLEIAEIHRELARIDPVLSTERKISQLEKEAGELHGLLEHEEDKEMRRCVSEELVVYGERILSLQNELISLLNSEEEEGSDHDVILEIRAGVGGLESSLFASDLFQMYKRFASLQKWRTEIMEFATSEMGGIKSGSLSLSGYGVFSRLRLENGVHRVQRVPLTEKAGRVQTSAASVVVMQQPTEVEIEINSEDLRIDVFRASGAGGQHVNTTESAVRITHKPTKLTVAIQDERSQHKNKEKALKLLKTKLYQLKKDEQEKELSMSRKESIGSGDRSQRIRTYNYPQNRVTDHRMNWSVHGIEEVMNGLNLEPLLDKLKQHSSIEKLKKLCKS